MTLQEFIDLFEYFPPNCVKVHYLDENKGTDYMYNKTRYLYDTGDDLGRMGDSKIRQMRLSMKNQGGLDIWVDYTIHKE